MAITIKAPNGKVVRVDDLPLGVLSKIAKEHEMGSWSVLLTAPAYDGGAFIDVYAEVCRVAGCEPEEITAGMVFKIVDRVEDDRPSMYEDGIPKEEADPETT